ncbi:MAG: GNAT family N-acetyltransferase [Planctomycetota bacterium]
MREYPVELMLTTEATATPIRNMYALHVHDIAAYEPRLPNAHGVLSDDPDHANWEDLADRQGDWWRKPGVLFPYALFVDGLPAGFALVASGPYIPTPGVDFVMWEFFVHHAWRGTGVAAEGVAQVLRRHPGRWEICTYPNAARPVGFWRKALPACALGEVEEALEDHPFGRKVVWRLEV